MGEHRLALDEEARAEVVRHIGSIDRAEKVIAWCESMLAQHGHPSGWQACEGDDAESQTRVELASTGSHLLGLLAGADAEQLAAFCGVRFGTVEALNVLLADLLAGLEDATRRAVPWRMRTQRAGVKAFLSLLVDQLQRAGLPMAHGERSHMVAVCRIVCRSLGLQLDPRDYMRPRCPGPLLSIERARTFLEDTRSEAERAVGQGTRA